jgi:thioredoxin-related protein
MKKIVIIAAAVVVIAGIWMAMATNWRNDFVKAKEKAKGEHKYILLSFSGSDWCIPCIRTKKEIFDKAAFSHFADSNLVLVNADFPRLKKNALPATEAKENEALAEQYNKEGAFPLTLLLDPNGRVIKEWKGYPGVDPTNFVEQIRSVEHSR